MPLTKAELKRYRRHLVIPEVGIEGQEKLKDSKVLIVGMGGLGSSASLYLAAAGIGKIGLVDFDVVDDTNLQRQIIYETKDVGSSKLKASKSRLKGINPNADIIVYEERLTSENAMQIIKNYDVVIDGSDNFPTRYLVNDACFLLDKPNVYGSVYQFEGHATVFRGNPCYRCLYKDPPKPGTVKTCAEGGVLGILPGIIGLIQATEAIKIILGKGEILTGRFLYFNALEMKFKELEITKNPECNLCSKGTITKLIDYDQFCGIKKDSIKINPNELKNRLSEIVLIDIREPWEYKICNIKNSKLMPMSKIERDRGSLDPDKEIVVYCHHGVRSLIIAKKLQRYGFKVKSLEGGIDQWAEEIEPEMARY